MKLLPELIIITIALGALVGLFAAPGDTVVNVPATETEIINNSPDVVVPVGFAVAYDATNPNVSDRVRQVIKEELLDNGLIGGRIGALATKEYVSSFVDKSIASISTDITSIQYGYMSSDESLFDRLSVIDESIQGVSRRIDSISTTIIDSNDLSVAIKEQSPKQPRISWVLWLFGSVGFVASIVSLAFIGRIYDKLNSGH